MDKFVLRHHRELAEMNVFDVAARDRFHAFAGKFQGDALGAVFGDEARSRITEVSASETAAAMKRAALVLDVRERQEFLRGHIPNAVHLARGTLELEIEKRAADPATEIVTYCGAGNRSALSTAKT